MRKAKWQGDDLWRLLNLPVSELQKIYPQEKKNTLKGKKFYWRKRVMAGEIEMPPTPEKDIEAREQSSQELIDGKLVSQEDGWWDVVTANPNDPENPIKTRAYKHSVKVRPDASTLPEDAFIRQGPAITIPRSRRRPVERNYELIAILPDEQIGFREINNELVPIHDEAAMQAARLILSHLQPDFVYANGDSIDFPTMSKYAKDSRHFTPRTVQASIDRATEWNAEITEATPNAKRVRMAGNHDRLSKYILNNAEEVYGLRRGATNEAPVLTTAYLTRAEELGWDYVSTYPGEYRHSLDLVIVHGDRVRSGGSTAELMSKTYPDRNVVFGHVHRRELHTRTNWDGRDYTAVTFGTLARIDGFVPSYGSSVNEATNQPNERVENWQQGIGLIEAYGDGEYNFMFVAIRNGIAKFRGKEYDGNES